MKNKPKAGKVLLLCAIGLLLAALLLWYGTESASRKLPEGALLLRFPDCGQADCCLVQAPGGETMLIDTGSAESAEHILPRLRRYGVTGIDHLILTHGHIDHTGGALAILRELPVGEVLLPGEHFADLDECGKLDRALAAAEEKGTVLRYLSSPFSLQMGTAFVNIYPSPLYTDDGQADNKDCLTVRLDHGSRSFLFCADHDADTEAALLETYGADCFDTDLLKVAHHGANSSTTEEFLAAVSPKLAVICCGLGNEYGHPHAAVLERLEEADVTILRTDLSGDLTLWCDGKRIGKEGG